MSLRADGITVEDLPRGQSRVDEARAIREAAELAFGGALSSAHLVRYTDPDDCEYENDVVAGEPESNRCKPLSIDRLAWLVVFRDAEVPIRGPPGRGGGTYDATIAAFVDAVTGRGIVAMTLPG